MATIVPATTYPDGSALSVADHNENVYSLTSGRGILSTPNGGLTAPNLTPTFTVRDEHVMSEEATIARAESNTTPIDIFSNAFGTIDLEDKNFVPVGGLSQRVYAPFDCGSALWQWSYFIAATRPYIQTDDVQKNITFQIRVYVDGQEYPAYRRQVAPSVEATSYKESYESLCAVHHDLAIVVTEVSKGFHDVSIKLFMQRNLVYEEGSTYVVKVDYTLFTHGLYLDPDQEGYGLRYDSSTGATYVINEETDEVVYGGELYDGISCAMYQRVTFGTRSVRCVLFK